MTRRAHHESPAPGRVGHDLCWLGALLMVGTLASSLGAMPPHRKKQPEPPEYALVTGTVFDPQGALVPNATVDVRELGRHHHDWEAITDEMGEFYVRVPPGKADYLVQASAPGFLPDHATVHVLAQERETIFLHLTPKKKK